MPDATDEPSETPPDEAQVVRSLRLFFEDYCIEENVAEADRSRVEYGKFFNFLSTQLNLMTAEHLAEEHRISQDAAEFVMSLPDREPREASLAGVWPYLVLSQKPREHPIRSVQLVCFILYDDGVLVPITHLAHKDIVTDPLDDANVVSFVVQSVPKIASVLAQEGLDGIHDKYAHSQTGMVDPQTIKNLRDCLAVSPYYNTRLPHDERRRIDQIVSLIDQMFPAKVPEQLRRKS